MKETFKLEKYYFIDLVQNLMFNFHHFQLWSVSSLIVKVAFLGHRYLA